jgi:cytoskeletal protein CcmA (bactofilin family)
MFTKAESKPSSGSDEISAFLGKKTVFEGKMTFQGVFRLDGQFEGEIFDSGTLVVGESAVVKGKVDVQTLVVHGTIEGEVQAKGRVEIHATGKFQGHLNTPVIVIQEGGILDGTCKMERTGAKQAESQPGASESGSSLAV